MQTKLTLSIHPSLLPEIKLLAEQKQTSVSHMVEEYFKRLLRLAKAGSFPRKTQTFPKTYRLLGSVKTNKTKIGMSEDELLTQSLEAKYL